MATFRKVGKRWRAEVCKRGRRASSYFDTKTAAREWASAKEFEFANLVEYVATRKRVGDMFGRYAAEVSPKKKGARWELVRLARFGRDAIADLLVSQVTAKDVAAWRDKRLGEVSPGTVNREMNLLSAVFEAARREWEWVAVNPVRGVQRPKNPKPRDRRISAAEITAIIDALGFDGVVLDKRHEVAVMFLIALETAMRLGEIHGLKKEHLHLDERFVELTDTKNNDARNVPLSREAVRLFGLVPDLFSVSKGSVTTLFRRAVASAGIDDLRFHDSRHEAITRLARKLDVLDLARMIGHRDPRSLMIYYNATASEIAGRLD